MAQIYFCLFTVRLVQWLINKYYKLNDHQNITKWTFTGSVKLLFIRNYLLYFSMNTAYVVTMWILVGRIYNCKPILFFVNMPFLPCIIII